ncbi:MAG: ATP-binding protein [Candidatus Heimdallarchaeota archaeon]|nr:ATP-binding protein [Candidatus Heimdallarchaeota archaeon]
MKVFSEISEGRLMKLDVDSITRYTYIVWFQYTRQQFNDIKEGDIIAVESFKLDNSSDKGKVKYYSLMKITQKLPMHYAQSVDLRGYPGFIEESAKSISESWISQETLSDDDLTKIVCECVPIGLEFIRGQNLADFNTDTSLPMLGKEARIVSEAILDRIINLGLEGDQNVIKLAKHKSYEGIEVLFNYFSSNNLHFGIFGYTGAGKSNLLSTYISKSIIEEQDRCLKYLIFDINDEFTGLLIDILSLNKNSLILNLSASYISGDLQSYYSTGSKGALIKAANAIYRQMHLPRSIRQRLQENNVLGKAFLDKITELITNRQYKVYKDDSRVTVKQYLDELISKEKTRTSTQKVKQAFIAALSDVGIYHQDFSEQTFDVLIEVTEYLANFVKPKKTTSQSADMNQFFGGEGQDTTDEGLKISAKAIDKISKLSLTDSQKGYFSQLQNVMQKDRSTKFAVLPDDMTIGRQAITQLMNKDESSIIIVVAHDNNELRKFSYEIGNYIYNNRIRYAQVYPQLNFVFDEADEFMPATASNDSQRDSKSIIEKLARRGRKYNLGIGIATQRIVYLDSNVMAQIHTYFISRLPRRADRERISEAFMLSISEFDQTNNFDLGNWLLVSDNATGIKNVPIPITMEDANKRILDFVK